MNEVIFNEKFCRVEYDRENDWVYVSWIGYQSVENIKKAMEVYLNAFKEKSCITLITDMRQAKGTFTSVNKWISNDWMPRALAVGLKYCAMVYGTDVFMKFATTDLNKIYEKSGITYFHMNSFDNIDFAIQWIRDEKEKEGNNNKVA